MNALEEATAALRVAELKLRTILVQAAEAGDYTHLPRIAEWAKLLSAASEDRLPPEAAPDQAESVPPAASDHGGSAPRVGGAVPVSDAVPHRSSASRRKKSGRARGARQGYPRFVRENDALVKIGWSKSEGKAYEHRAPRGVLRALVQALARVGAGGERFTVEALLPLRDGGAGSNVPDYQTYLTLAWLRSVGLVTQHGRQGYTLPAGMDLEREAERHWEELAAR